MARRITIKSADELAQIGLRHHRAGDVAQAERSYRAALSRSADHVGALTLLSTLLLQRREHGAAVELLERATALAPQHGVLYSNLGEALRRLDRKDEALLAFQRAVQLSPELAEAHYNLGLLLDQLGRRPQAIAAYEAALELRPELPGGLSTLLEALRDEAEYGRASRWYQRLARTVPDSPQVRCAIAGVLCDTFRLDEAVQHLQQAIALEPNSARAHGDLGVTLAERGEVDEAIEHVRRATALDPENPTYQSHLIYLLAFSERTQPFDILEAAREFGRRHVAHLPRFGPVESGGAAPGRLRIGYVSGDLRAHPVAQFFKPLLQHHDRDRFEIFCYSNVRRPDFVTSELRVLADGWRDISVLDDERAAEIIRQDRIDVLIDLSQHSAHHRLLVFARKPAPVQLSWLGYPGTTGVAAIDYRITDPQLDPPELGNPASTEQLLWLPNSFWCYAPPPEAPDVSELPALANGYVTFGSMNSFKKVSDASLKLWAQVLAAVPDSRLVLVAPRGKARERVQRVMEANGVDMTRVELLGHLSKADYFATYQRIDIALDSVPYNGGTTTFDALWMGVPVITVPGQLATARAGAAVLDKVLGAWVASKTEDCPAIAARYASRLDELADLRRSIRHRLRRSSLLDALGFTKQLEQVYLRAAGADAAASLLG